MNGGSIAKRPRDARDSALLSLPLASSLLPSCLRRLRPSRVVAAHRHPCAFGARDDVPHTNGGGGVRDAAGDEIGEERSRHALSAYRVEIIECLADECAHALA